MALINIHASFPFVPLFETIYFLMFAIRIQIKLKGIHAYH